MLGSFVACALSYLKPMLYEIFLCLDTFPAVFVDVKVVFLQVAFSTKKSKMKMGKASALSNNLSKEPSLKSIEGNNSFSIISLLNLT